MRRSAIHYKKQRARARFWLLPAAFCMRRFLKQKAGEIFPGLLWSWKCDSNTRPADYESAALPTELFQHFLFFLCSLEPALSLYFFLQDSSTPFRKKIFAAL